MPLYVLVVINMVIMMITVELNKALGSNPVLVARLPWGACCRKLTLISG